MEVGFRLKDIRVDEGIQSACEKSNTSTICFPRLAFCTPHRLDAARDKKSAGETGMYMGRKKGEHGEKAEELMATSRRCLLAVCAAFGVAFLNPHTLQSPAQLQPESFLGFLWV